MAETVNLSDAELQAATANGLLSDPAVLGKLDADTRARYDRLTSAPPKTASVSPTARPEMRRPVAAGRGTQFDPTLPNKAVEVATTPLGHPTGIDAIDSMTSPVGLASLAAGGYGIARAGLESGLPAAAKEALSQATPLVKYEATRSMLRAVGVPDSLASVVGAALSGYKAKGPTPTAAELEEAQLVKAGVNPQTIERMKAQGKFGAAISRGETAPAGTPPPSAAPPAPVVAAPAPSAPAPGPSATVVPGSPTPPPLVPEGTVVPPATAEHYPQKFMNETAIQARRQGVKLSDSDYAVAKGMVDQGATPQQAVQTIATARETATTAGMSPRPKVTAADFLAYQKLIQQGMTHQQALAAIEAQKAFLSGQGLPSSADVAARVAARNATGRWPQ